jgi:hypothetical protein
MGRKRSQKTTHRVRTVWKQAERDTRRQELEQTAKASNKTVEEVAIAERAQSSKVSANNDEPTAGAASTATATTSGAERERSIDVPCATST